jgi:predicted site-specific integrase-resolvase
MLRDPITSTTAAQIIGCAESTIRLWMDQGILPFHRLPSGIRLIERTNAIRIAQQRQQERAANAE